MNNKPLTKFREKGLTVTIWPTSNGGYNGNLTKSYKKKTDTEWTNVPSKDKPTLSLYEDELRAMAKLCNDAADWMHAQGKEQEHSEAKGNGYAPDNGLDPSDRKYVPGGKDVSGFDDSEIPF